MVTDGVVHDIPNSLAQLGIKAPLHVLVTGHADERDRQIKLVEAPRFGIVGKDVKIRAEVMERGGTGTRSSSPAATARRSTGATSPPAAPSICPRGSSMVARTSSRSRSSRSPTN